MSATKKIASLLAQTSAVMHTNELVTEMLYPRRAADFKHACTFRGGSGDIFRLRQQVGYRLHPTGEGVTNAEMVGGLVEGGCYTIWATESGEHDRQGAAVYDIVWMTRTDTSDGETFAQLQGQLAQHAIRAAMPPAMVAYELGQKTELERDDIIDGINEKPKGALARFDRASAFLRIALEPDLFRLYEQSTLLGLKLNQFLALGETLREPSNNPQAREAIASLCFPYLHEQPGLPRLRSNTLHAVARHYGYPGIVGMPASDWCIFCVGLDFLQKAIDQQERDGHSYSTQTQLSDAYMAAIEGHDRFQSNASRFFALADRCALTDEAVRDAMPTHIQMGVHLRILTQTREAFDPRRPRCGKMAPNQVVPGPGGENACLVYYPSDVWIRQCFVRDLTRQLLARWDRTRDADDCITESDVHAKIARGRRPRNALRGPRWDNREFQTCWSTLDPLQKQAVARAILHPITFITGPPGCGKTEVFRALRFLYSGHTVAPFAAYGRIASMLRERTGYGWTIHRAQALVQANADVDDLALLKKARTALIDEFSLITTDHLARLFEMGPKQFVRIVMAGDPNQMGAIGSGTITDSFMLALEGQPDLHTQLNIPHRFLPRRGVGMDRAQIDALLMERPAPQDPMSTVWNMNQMLRQMDGRNAYAPIDLVYSTTDPKARLLILPDCTSAAAFQRQLSTCAGLSLSDLNDVDIQGITKLNADCSHLSRTFREAMGKGADKSNAHRFQVGEKITFLSNAYLAESAGGKRAGGDVDLDYRAMRDAKKRGQKRSRAGEPLQYENYTTNDDDDDDQSSTKRPAQKRQRTHQWRGTDSDDVFNGDIRSLRAVYTVNDYGAVTGQPDDTAPGRTTDSLVLEFHDGTQLNLADYESEKIRSGLLVTSKKMQGSERKGILDFLRGHYFLYAEEIYTKLTRATDRYIIVSPYSIHKTLLLLQRILARRAPKKRERVAMHVPLTAALH